MTHDRDGWPEPRLINGHYRVEDDGPPYADMEQRVPDAWTDGGPTTFPSPRADKSDSGGSFRRGLLFGCGTELAALAAVVAVWWVWLR